jgi:hypothetical protein
MCSPAKGGKLPGFAEFQPSRPAVEASAVSDAKTTPLMARMIRQSYEALVRYSQPSGKAIAFQLSNFRTYNAPEFDLVRWFDVVTMPGGDVIQVESRTHQTSANLRLGRTEYVPQWKKEPEYGETKEGHFVSGLTVTQAFQAALADEPRLAAVSKLTAYDVTVTLEGRSRTYRAAFLWVDEREGLTMLPYDYITGRVATALVEKFLPGNRAPRVAPAPWDRTAPTKEACIAEEVALRSFGLSYQDSTDHTSGNHNVNGAFSASCQCNSDCSQDCYSNGFGGCEDWGDGGGTWGCHKISNPGFASADDHVSSGTATCRATAACSWKSCFACLCGGPSISVSYGGFGVSIGGSPESIVISKESSFTCPACRNEPPPPPPPGGGGGDDDGGGDDGGGGGMCEEGDWVTEWECIYVCGGWSDGEFCWVDPNMN